MVLRVVVWEDLVDVHPPFPVARKVAVGAVAVRDAAVGLVDVADLPHPVPEALPFRRVRCRADPKDLSILWHLAHLSKRPARARWVARVGAVPVQECVMRHQCCAKVASA